MIGNTGPKVSSRMIRIEWSTSVKTVGSKWSPSEPVLRPPHRIFAPFSFASARCASTMSSCRGKVIDPTSRSEEHTSELQSREKLVCRLLLEKKKDIWTKMQQ